jgi:hypothetical protein
VAESGLANGLHCRVTTNADGPEWDVDEFVGDADFTASDFERFSGSALSSEYRGLSITRVPATGDQNDQVILAFVDKDKAIGDVGTGGEPVMLILATADALWGRPWNLNDMPGPSVTVSQISGPKIRVVSDYDAVMPGQTGLVENTLKQIIIRYSTTRFPLDPDGHDDGSTVLKNRALWNGSSRTDDTPANVAAGTYYISVWAVGVEGISKPSRRRLVVT